VVKISFLFTNELDTQNQIRSQIEDRIPSRVVAGLMKRMLLKAGFMKRILCQLEAGFMKQFLAK